MHHSHNGFRFKIPFFSVKGRGGGVTTDDKLRVKRMGGEGVEKNYFPLVKTNCSMPSRASLIHYPFIINLFIEEGRGYFDTRAGGWGNQLQGEYKKEFPNDKFALRGCVFLSGKNKLNFFQSLTK